MKALTLHEPWASLIATGHKTIETRSWHPPADLVGQRIAIHAGKHVDHGMWAMLERRFGDFDVFEGAVICIARLAWYGQVYATYPDTWHDGELLAQVTGHDGAIFTVDVDEWGDFSEGRWLWGLEDVEWLDPPVRVNGQMGLWNWSPGPGIEVPVGMAPLRESAPAARSCPRCGGRLNPSGEDDELRCINCGHRAYVGAEAA